MEDLVGCGVTSLHPIEPKAMDIAEVKRRMGGRLAVMGNIDVDLLTRGSEADIRKRVREVVTVCQPGGGFFLGSGNTVANYVPLDNYLAMLDEGRRL